ncbi:hypothetical protein BGX23_011147 [Mortierella sp. AD031]|nr:hypothetical protein BGX23_011147 [Mortierella sp. AD031]
MFGKKKQPESESSVSSRQDDTPVQIPMEPLAEKEVFEPLPEPVDFSGINPTTRYQFRGMARRALSYHRRQRITNIGCLVIWPILLVVLSYTLTQSMTKNNQGTIRYCTNEADPQFGREFDLTWGGFLETDNRVYNSPYYPRTLEIDDRKQENCVRWFGETYPVNAPYQNATWADTPALNAYYIPSPDFGWFNKSKVQKARGAFTGHEMRYDFPTRPYVLYSIGDVNQTVYYSAANAEIAKALGMTANVTQRFVSKSWPPVDPNIVFYNSSMSDPARGVLGAIPIRYTASMTLDVSDKSGRDYIDMYSAAPTYRSYENKARVEEAIADLVMDYSEGRTYYYGFDNQMPFGGLHYDALDVEKAKVSMTMQFGTLRSDGMNDESVTPGLRQMIVMTQMTNAIARLKSKGQYIISQGIRALPYEYDWSRLNTRGSGEAAGYMFPFALSFLLPTFVSILVQEKEDRHRMMMSMNGLTSGAYYLAHYAEFMTMQLILTLFFAFTCAAIKNEYVWRTNSGLVILLFLLWAHVQTSLSFFLASFFSKARKATLVVYFFVALSAILSSIAGVIFSGGIPFAWYIHPTFSFFRILSLGMMHASMVNQLYPLSFADFTVGYIDAVAPSEYGVRRPWHFPISGLFKSRSNSSAGGRDLESKIAKGGSHANLTDSDHDSFDDGDADVRAEREHVRTKYEPETTPLIIDNLYHCYSGKIDPALKGMSFGVEKNTVLGLLGPNGAGKSTLIHLLTGLYEPTRGSASVAGANIRTEMQLVHSRMGVCPQHDILWGDLTVADHLLFYARLRGVPPSLEQQTVAYAIGSVSLTKFRDRQVKGLSGGERRRVSIAISLLGDNRVIFLDEPSTGLDPEVRRVIWDIVNRVKVNRTVVLTTHSMEEADILSDRIAIMTNGLLRCIGTSLHLKELYGSGFRLNITSKPGRLDEACQSIEEKLMRRTGRPYRRIDKFTNASVFEFDVGQDEEDQAAVHSSGIQDLSQKQEGTAVKKRGELSSVFYYLSQRDLFPAVEDWGISQTTLEDVFIKIVTDADASLTVPAIIQDTNE